MTCRMAPCQAYIWLLPENSDALRAMLRRVGEPIAADYLRDMRRVASTCLPPDHREVIAEALGCSDRPAEFWERRPLQADFDHHNPIFTGYWCCDCWSVETIHVRAIEAGGSRYLAGICESPDGLSGCGKVWWTRREATLTDAIRTARGGTPPVQRRGFA